MSKDKESSPRKSKKRSSGKKKKGKKKRRAKLAPEVKAKAKKLEKKNGIPYNYAVQVAQGKKTLPQVLKELMKKEKINKLVKKYDMERAMAGQVAHKQISLDEALAIMDYRKMKKKVAHNTCFAVSEKEKRPFLWACHGPENRFGVVTQNDKYDINLKIEGEEEILRLPKLEVKFACPKEDSQAVLDHINKAKEVAQKDLGPIKKMVKRYRVKDSQLRRYWSGEKTVRFTTLEGEVLAGVIDWFNLYEIYLNLTEDLSVYLLRHALYSWETVED